jgi:hypothetical protein
MRGPLRLRWRTGTARNPPLGRIEAAVLSLARDSHVVLEDVRPEHHDEYIQVVLRGDGIYQLEYRDGSADRHYQTLTLSPAKVIDAMDGWRTGKTEWRDGFQWSPWSGNSGLFE